MENFQILDVGALFNGNEVWMTPSQPGTDGASEGGPATVAAAATQAQGWCWGERCGTAAALLLLYAQCRGGGGGGAASRLLC